MGMHRCNGVFTLVPESWYAYELIGDAFDLDRTYIILLERRSRQPTLTTLIVLGDFLGLTPGSLVDRTMTRVRKGTKR